MLAMPLHSAQDEDQHQSVLAASFDWDDGIFKDIPACPAPSTPPSKPKSRAPPKTPAALGPKPVAHALPKVAGTASAAGVAGPSSPSSLLPVPANNTPPPLTLPHPLTLLDLAPAAVATADLLTKYWETASPILKAGLKGCRFTAMHVNAHSERLRRACFARNAVCVWDRAAAEVTRALKQRKVDHAAFTSDTGAMRAFLLTLEPAPDPDTRGQADTDTRCTRKRTYATLGAADLHAAAPSAPPPLDSQRSPAPAPAVEPDTPAAKPDPVAKPDTPAAEPATAPPDASAAVDARAPCAAEHLDAVSSPCFPPACSPACPLPRPRFLLHVMPTPRLRFPTPRVQLTACCTSLACSHTPACAPSLLPAAFSCPSLDPPARYRPQRSRRCPRSPLPEPCLTLARLQAPLAPVAPP